MKKEKLNWIIYALAIALSFIPVYIIFYQFSGEYSNSLIDWGNWGQYISGTAGTLLSALTIILVVQSINIQTKEFKSMINNQKDTIALLSNQNVENTFYHLLDLHHRIVENICLENEKSPVKGRSAFYKVAHTCQSIWYSEKDSKQTEIKKVINSKKEGFIHYLENLKYTFSYIDSISDENLKTKCINIYKAQLSNSELILIGYFTVFSLFDLKRTINDYNVLENIDFEDGVELIDGEKPLAIRELLVLMKKEVK